jgi:RNA-binding protein
VDTSFKQSLKAQAHHLKPVILMGAKGLTDAVVAETHIALESHELIKVKISGAEKEDRLEMATNLCQQLQAELVQMIGTTAIIYRKNKENDKPEKKEKPVKNHKKTR